MNPPEPGDQIIVTENERGSLVLECYKSHILGVMYRTRITGPLVYIKGSANKDFSRTLREGLAMFEGWEEGVKGL